MSVLACGAMWYGRTRDYGRPRSPGLMGLHLSRSRWSLLDTDLQLAVESFLIYFDLFPALA